MVVCCVCLGMAWTSSTTHPLYLSTSGNVLFVPPQPGAHLSVEECTFNAIWIDLTREGYDCLCFGGCIQLLVQSLLDSISLAIVSIAPSKWAPLLLAVETVNLDFHTLLLNKGHALCLPLPQPIPAFAALLTPDWQALYIHILTSIPHIKHIQFLAHSLIELLTNNNPYATAASHNNMRMVIFILLHLIKDLPQPPPPHPTLVLVRCPSARPTYRQPGLWPTNANPCQLQGGVFLLSSPPSTFSPLSSPTLTTSQVALPRPLGTPPHTPPSLTDHLPPW